MASGAGKKRTAPGRALPGRRVMEGRAADNVYLHQDFHGALNQALIYLERQFGADAVREYLDEFARAFYAPLKKAIAARGLAALRDHWQKVYSAEGADFTIESFPDELIVRVTACPAVSRIRQMGLTPSPRFEETTRTVNAAICEGTDFAFELVEYDPETGRRVERYARRRP